MANEFENKPYASSTQIKQISIWKIGDESGKPYANLSELAFYLQYYEDIMLPSYAATLIVVDNAENLISSMPIQGFEKVVFEVEDAKKETYSYEFRVWTVANRVAKDRRQMYTLGLISAEALVNEGTRVNTIFKGNTSEQVKKLLKEKLGVSESNIDVETCLNTVKILPTKKTPFALIRSLQTKTIPSETKTKSKVVGLEVVPFGGSESYTSSVSDVGSGAQKASGSAGYFFFQTRKGFVFKSVDALARHESDGGTPTVGKTYYYQYGKGDNESSYKIQEILYDQEINMMKKLREGSYSSIVCCFNINTGKYEEIVYSLKDTWKDMYHMGSQVKLPSGQEKLSEYPSRVMSTIINHENWYSGTDIASNEEGDGSENPSEFPDYQKQYISQSIARVGIMFTQKLTISLTGQLELVVGDKVEVRVPNQVPDTERDKQQWDSENSGTFLISKLNHQFDIKNQSVYTVLELIRDSYGIKDQESNVK